MTDTGIVNIHGKQYHTVAKRVQDFRQSHPTFGLITEVAFRDGNLVAMKASILDETGRVIATGHAEEDRTKGQINRSSALENAETSAIGRALAAFGIGGTEFASANEVQNAMHQQAEPPPTINEDERLQLVALFEATGTNAAPYLAKAAKNTGLPVKDLRDLPASEFWPLKEHLESKKAKEPANA
jgi:hypothetical protein